MVCKYLVPEIVFGEGALAEAGHAARRLGGRHVFVVTDPGIIAAGWVDEIQGHLRAARLAVTLWHGVTPNPKDREIEAGLRVYLDAGCDVLVAIGGGSCMDAAKGVAIRTANGGSILDYAGIGKVTRGIPPTVMIPTTSGTGADVSQFAVITDTVRRVKATIIGRALVPDISLTDPRPLITMPEWLNATTALDALTHGIEAYVSRAASRLTDGHALAAVRLVSRNLLSTLDRPDDMTARTAMAQGSLEAGIAFTNAILGATHAMSHQVGGLLDLPHGLVNGILLPHVIRFNAAAVADRYVDVAAALGIDAAGMDGLEAAEATAETVRLLADKVGVPRGLAEIGVPAELVETLAASAHEDACLATNPRESTVDDIAALFRTAM